MKDIKGQKIWIVVSKQGMPMMFLGKEPVKKDDQWIGTHYVNSIIYEQVCDIANAVGLTFDDDPEFIEFQIMS